MTTNAMKARTTMSIRKMDVRVDGGKESVAVVQANVLRGHADVRRRSPPLLKRSTSCRRICPSSRTELAVTAPTSPIGLGRFRVDRLPPPSPIEPVSRS